MEAEIIYGLLGILICLFVILIIQVIRLRRECNINRQLLNRTKIEPNVNNKHSFLTDLKHE